MKTIQTLTTVTLALAAMACSRHSNQDVGLDVPAPSSDTPFDVAPATPSPEVTDPTVLVTPPQAPDIVVGTVNSGGAGCPAGTTEVFLSDDRRSLELHLEQFHVEAGADTGRRLDRKVCTLAIPFQVPAGISIAVNGLSLEGSHYISENAQTRLNVETFLAGGQGPLLTQTFEGAQEGGFAVDTTVNEEALQWSACGEGVILRANMSLLAQARSPEAFAATSVHRVGARDGILMNIMWRTCDQH